MHSGLQTQVSEYREVPGMPSRCRTTELFCLSASAYSSNERHTSRLWPCYHQHYHPGWQTFASTSPNRKFPLSILNHRRRIDGWMTWWPGKFAIRSACTKVPGSVVTLAVLASARAYLDAVMERLAMDAEACGESSWLPSPFSRNLIFWPVSLEAGWQQSLTN
jgi:hypothetical protein